MQQLVEDIADACFRIDASGVPFKSYQPGVGPYSEPQLVKQVAAYLNNLPAYRGRAVAKRTPDLLISNLWALEFKIARPFGDNGAEAENWSVNLLHPYPGNFSVYGDCLKLRSWAGSERRAAIMVGFEHAIPVISLDPVFEAFEAIAARLLPFSIGPRSEARRSGLRHPVHAVVRVVGWEVPAP